MEDSRSWCRAATAAATSAATRSRGGPQQTLCFETLTLPLAQHPGVFAMEVQDLAANAMRICLVHLQACLRAVASCTAVDVADKTLGGSRQMGEFL